MNTNNNEQPSKTQKDIEQAPLGEDVQMKSSASVSSNPAISEEKSENVEKFDSILINDRWLESEELGSIKSLASGIDTMEINAIEMGIGNACKQCKKHSEIAVQASTLVATNAWLTGKLLLRAKSLLKKKGEFGAWCETHLVQRGLMSVKTAQRYMAVANKWESLDTMLAKVPNLWTAYQDAGIVPVPDDSENSKKSVATVETATGPQSNKVNEYVAQINEVKKMLRKIKPLQKGIGVDISAAEQAEINLILDDVIKFAKQLRGKDASDEI